MKLNRYFGHFEGDAMTYRGAGEVEHLRKTKDPLDIFRDRVRDARLLSAADFDKIETEVEAKIAHALRSAKAAPMPSPEVLTTDVYATYN
jgi:pyruvate dehydrogenase E1 component alpha subunit